MGCFYYSENLNWAAQNLRHESRVGHSWSRRWQFPKATKSVKFNPATSDSFFYCFFRTKIDLTTK